MSDLIYGSTIITEDQNTFSVAYKSLASTLRGSWTGQDEPLNNRIIVKIPYVPKVDDNGVWALWMFYISDRLALPNLMTAGFRLPTVSSDVNLRNYAPIPLACKQNYILRNTSTPIRLTIIVTSSAVVQGCISFHITRNLTRGLSDIAVGFYNPNITTDQSNAVAVMNLATDRNVTIDIPYDEWYSFIGHGHGSSILDQPMFRGLACVPLTPLSTTGGEPAELYFTVLYSTGLPVGTGLVNAPNLALFSSKMADIVPAELPDVVGNPIANNETTAQSTHTNTNTYSQSYSQQYQQAGAYAQHSNYQTGSTVQHPSYQVAQGHEFFHSMAAPVETTQQSVVSSSVVTTTAKPKGSSSPNRMTTSINQLRSNAQTNN